MLNAAMNDKVCCASKANWEFLFFAIVFFPDWAEHCIYVVHRLFRRCLHVFYMFTCYLHVVLMYITSGKY